MEDPTRPGCPKRMVFGPCGGVRADGGCEVDGRPCVFVATAAPAWSGPPRRPASDRSGLPTGGAAPWVVTDLHGRPRHRGSLRAVAARLRGTCDAVLVGDHGGRRNDFPPSFTAGVVMAEGLAPWVTLSCRDRNRVALAAECAALAEMGVAGVHCVTGDWQGSGGGVGEAKVFDLDALRLVDYLAIRGSQAGRWHIAVKRLGSHTLGEETFGPRRRAASRPSARGNGWAPSKDPRTPSWLPTTPCPDGQPGRRDRCYHQLAGL